MFGLVKSIRRACTPAGATEGNGGIADGGGGKPGGRPGGGEQQVTWNFARSFQLAPPSMVWNSPSSPPRYSVLGSTGSPARTWMFRMRRPVLESRQVAPASVLLKTPPVNVAANIVDESAGLTAIYAGTGIPGLIKFQVRPLSTLLYNSVLLPA